MSEQIGFLRKIEVNHDTGDVSFFFNDSEEPFSSREFEKNSRTRMRLEAFESAINWFNGPHWRDHP